VAAGMLKALELEARLSDLDEAAVYILLGDDDALRAHCLGLLKAALAPADSPGSTVRVFETTAAASDVFAELRTLPFMGLAGRRVVTVERGDAFLQSHWEGLLRYLQQPARAGKLVLCVSRLDPKAPPAGHAGDADARADRAKAWQALMKVMAARGAMVDCSRLTWPDARTWVRTYADRIGGKVTPRAAGALVEALGPNLLALRNEVDKLCTRAGSEAVTERDVDEFVSQGRSRSAFDLAEAVGRADAASALRLCGRLLLQGESREAIVAVLGLQLRRLWQIKRFRAAGMSEQEAIRRSDAPAFAVRRALKAVEPVPEGRFARQIALLAASDAESKAASLRSEEEQVWLESLLVRLCRA
jgi:DNA polymerase III delta subunit